MSTHKCLYWTISYSKIDRNRSDSSLAAIIRTCSLFAPYVPALSCGYLESAEIFQELIFHSDDFLFEPISVEGIRAPFLLGWVYFARNWDFRDFQHFSAFFAFLVNSGEEMQNWFVPPKFEEIAPMILVNPSLLIVYSIGWKRRLWIHQ